MKSSAAAWAERFEHIAPNQRPIPRQDKHIPLVPFQFFLTHPRRMPGAELFGLLDPVDAIVVTELGDDVFLAVTDDHDDFVAPGAETGIEHPAEHRLAADFVKRLGAARFHSRRLAGG